MYQRLYHKYKRAYLNLEQMIGGVRIPLNQILMQRRIINAVRAEHREIPFEYVMDPQQPFGELRRMAAVRKADPNTLPSVRLMIRKNGYEILDGAHRIAWAIIRGQRDIIAEIVPNPHFEVPNVTWP